MRTFRWFVWDPRVGRAGQRRQSLTQTIDIGPTLLEFFELDVPADAQGRSLRPVIDNDSPIRDAALFGMFGGHVNVTDGRYVYMRGPVEGNAPLNHYTLMPTHMRSPFSVRELADMEWSAPLSFTKGCPVMKIPSRGMGRFVEELTTKLWDVETDPQQQNMLSDAAVERHMIDKLMAALAESDAPPEQFERLGLS